MPLLRGGRIGPNRHTGEIESCVGKYLQTCSQYGLKSGAVSIRCRLMAGHAPHGLRPVF